ncbi:MAG: AAC(3) family N-acetyltransferase [Anaerolineae bacterium]|nr:AAC(3) family N-acetyltransferase [Anaerolineae bacterium]
MANPSTASITQSDIARGLAALGLAKGHKVLVHSSLSSFGHVEGGADAVIGALLEAVGPHGTVLVPTLTGDETLSPARPPVFDPAQTPCWTGRIPETFRQRPGAVRSRHPTHSVAAIGAGALALTQDHLQSVTPCDARSPYGKLAQLPDGYILLLGVDHEASTMFHHIEEAVGVGYHMQPGFARATLYIDGETIHRHYMLHRYGPRRHFNAMEPVFIERGIQRAAHIGQSYARLVHAGRMCEVTRQCLAADPRILLFDK